jgi:hypothetical protein
VSVATVVVAVAVALALGGGGAGWRWRWVAVATVLDANDDLLFQCDLYSGQARYLYYCTGSGLPVLLPLTLPSGLQPRLR